MIVADTGAILALLDKGDRHHAAVRELYEDRPDDWLLPWAILPEVDYLVSSELGARAQEAFLADRRRRFLRRGIRQAARMSFAPTRSAGNTARSKLGLVDAVVMAIAERLRADAIATLDLRHFGAVKIAGSPLLFRDARCPR